MKNFTKCLPMFSVKFLVDLAFLKAVPFAVESAEFASEFQTKRVDDLSLNV